MEILVEVIFLIIIYFWRLNENWIYYSICWCIVFVWCNVKESGFFGKFFDIKGYFIIFVWIDCYYLIWLFFYFVLYLCVIVFWFCFNFVNVLICIFFGFCIYINIYLYWYYLLLVYNIDILYKWKSEIYLLKKILEK